MSIDISRRSFLKGVMATAAIVAVAPSLIVPVPAVGAAVTPLVDKADLWLKPDGQWRFIGKLLSASIRPEPHPTIIDVTTDPAVPEWMRGLPEPRRALGDLSVCVDDDGRRYLDEAFLSGIGTGICIGTRFGPAVIEKALITRHSWEVNIKEPAMVDYLDFIVSGKPGWPV